jgi:hypothetical protein
MARYSAHFLSRGVDFDFTMDRQGYELTADLKAFQPPEAKPLIGLPEGWQAAVNAREGFGQGLAYIRSIAGIQEWTVGKNGKMYVRRRAARPLTVELQFPVAKVSVRIVDLDAGTSRRQEVAGNGKLDLGTTDHDFAIRWEK